MQNGAAATAKEYEKADNWHWVVFRRCNNFNPEQWKLNNVQNLYSIINNKYTTKVLSHHSSIWSPCRCCSSCQIDMSPLCNQSCSSVSSTETGSKWDTLIVRFSTTCPLTPANRPRKSLVHICITWCAGVKWAFSRKQVNSELFTGTSFCTCSDFFRPISRWNGNLEQKRWPVT